MWVEKDPGPDGEWRYLRTYRTNKDNGRTVYSHLELRLLSVYGRSTGSTGTLRITLLFRTCQTLCLERLPLSDTIRINLYGCPKTKLCLVGKNNSYVKQTVLE